MSDPVRRALLAMTLLLILAACDRDAAPADAITITDAWARPTMPGQTTGVVYLTITNDGPVDRLVAVSAEIAAAATLHRSETVDGIARMRPMTAVAIPTDTPVHLAPGGLHIMLADLAGPLAQDRSFAMTLTFEKAGPIAATVDVRPGGAWQLRQDPDAAPAHDGSTDTPSDGDGE